jgi:hypothetical protein
MLTRCTRCYTGAVPLEENKSCLECGGAFYRHTSESSAQWGDRKYCSHKCGYAVRRAKALARIKVCAVSGKVFAWAGVQKIARQFLCCRKCVGGDRLMTQRQGVSINYTVAGEGCRMWNRTINSDGYSTFELRGRAYKVYRYFYELHVGPMSAENEVHHACRNPRCIRSDHLVQLSAAEHRVVSQNFLAERKSRKDSLQSAATRCLVRIFISIGVCVTAAFVGCKRSGA